MSALIFILVVWGIVMIPFVVYMRKMQKQKDEMNTMKHLSSLLFPEGEAQRDKTIGSIMDMTGNRFSQEEILDFYLKIKGLQMVDMNTFGDDGVRNFLMQPTKIRLQYRELVEFYEKYLNLPQPKGMNAMGSYSGFGETK